MNKLLSLRVISPALLDTSVFSCTTLQFSVRCVSTSACLYRNKGIKVNPLFTNRNPRALEYLGLEPKQKGWKYQAPRQDFYHKLVYEKEATTAYVQHSSGKIIVSASAKEPAVAKHLYSTTDVSANWNVGRLLGRRMLEAGINNVIYDELNTDVHSEKKKAFISALMDCAIQFSEAEEVKQEYVPGINYEGYNRLNEKRVYQTDYQKLKKSD